MGIMKRIADEFKSNVKQGIGDAADTILRAPARMAGMMGLKQSQGNVSPNNKGERAAKELVSRAGSAIKAGKAAFSSKKKTMKK